MQWDFQDDTSAVLLHNGRKAGSMVLTMDRTEWLWRTLPMPSSRSGRYPNEGLARLKVERLLWAAAHEVWAEGLRNA